MLHTALAIRCVCSCCLFCFLFFIIIPMACIGNRGCTVMLCLGLFVAARSFCNCTEPISIQTKITSLVRTPKTRDTSTLIQGLREGDGSIGAHHGRLLIGRNSVPSGKLKGIKSLKNLLGVHSDYQSDMGM